MNANSRDPGLVTDRSLSADDVRRLYEGHGRVLLAYARSFLRDAAAAEDVLHQVFARLLRGGVSIDGPPLPYLCRAVRNVALNDRRRLTREVELEPRVMWLEAPAGLQEVGLAIEQAVDSLAADQREIVVLRVWGQLTFQEIGDTLAISPNTAASRYRYGLGKLREMLKPFGAE